MSTTQVERLSEAVEPDAATIKIWTKHLVRGTMDKIRDRVWEHLGYDKGEQTTTALASLTDEQMRAFALMIELQHIVNTISDLPEWLEMWYQSMIDVIRQRLPSRHA